MSACYCLRDIHKSRAWRGRTWAMILEAIDQAPTASSVTDLADHIVAIGRKGLLRGILQARD